jgi:hypothetical protein
MAQGQAVRSIPENAGQQKCTRQAFSAPPPLPIGVRDACEQSNAADAKEGEGRSCPIVLPSRSESETGVRDRVGGEIPRN